MFGDLTDKELNQLWGFMVIAQEDMFVKHAERRPGLVAEVTGVLVDVVQECESRV